MITMAHGSPLNPSQEDFKRALDNKLKEMSKVADLKAKFNQDLQLTKPPVHVKKPAVSTPASKPKPTVKPSVVTNADRNKPPPLVPNGLDLKSVQLKPSVKSKPITSPKPWERETESSSQPSVADLRSRLKSVSPQPSTAPKPQITPKPAAKPPVQSSKPLVTQRANNFSAGNSWKKKSTSSEERDHSASGSIGSTLSDSSHDKEESFVLAPLPRLETIGSPPQKPPKPRNVKLPPPTGVRSRKPVEPPIVQPPVPQRVPPPTPPDDDDGPQEVYDDVEKPPPLPPMANRPSLNDSSKRVSMIPTMNSDDEFEPDELYDEGSSGPVTNGPPPVLPPIDSLPVFHPHQTSGGSSSSLILTSGTSDNTGSGGDSGEVYDPVEEEHDFDELYEPLDIDEQPDGTATTNGGLESNAEKEKEAERKKLEKQRKEEEKQQKKEEEKRKKEEKEEKKKKEKAEKELKKKFKVKGDWTVEGKGTAAEDVADENDKLSVICTKGETLEILRKDSPNPPGKWLVRNEWGDPGYIDSHLVQLEGDFGELYDDVGISDGEDFQDVYDTAS